MSSYCCLGEGLPHPPQFANPMFSKLWDAAWDKYEKEQEHNHDVARRAAERKEERRKLKLAYGVLTGDPGSLRQIGVPTSQLGGGS